MGLFSIFKNKESNEYLNGVCFICTHVLKNVENVKYISHKNNDDYELLCESCSKRFDFSNINVVGIEEIKRILNPNFLNIENGKYLLNQDGEGWFEYSIENDEYNKEVFLAEDEIIAENIKRNGELRSDISGIKIKRN